MSTYGRRKTPHNWIMALLWVRSGWYENDLFCCFWPNLDPHFGSKGLIWNSLNNILIFNRLERWIAENNAFWQKNTQNRKRFITQPKHIACYFDKMKSFRNLMICFFCYFCKNMFLMLGVCGPCYNKLVAIIAILGFWLFFFSFRTTRLQHKLLTES